MWGRLKSFFERWVQALRRVIVGTFSAGWDRLKDPAHGANSPRFTWLVVPALLAALVLWKFPPWQMSLTKGLAPDRAFELENEARKTLAQIVLGLFGLIALFLTWRRTWTTEQGHFTDRYSKAIEQLGAMDKDGNPNIEVRLGGIYALERLARDSPRDQGTILEVFTAYVRRNAAWPPAPEFNPPLMEGREADPEPRTDIQAILTVIGRRRRGSHRVEEKIDLVRTDLRGASLDGAHLEGANLHGTHLEGAHLSGTHLEGVALMEAYLERADLRSAHLERSDLYEARLEGANFRQAHLEGAHLREAHLEGEDLREAHLERADLEGAHLEGAHLREAHLEGAHLREAHLERAMLLLAHLEAAEFTGAHLEEARLSGADLKGAYFAGADLRGAHLEGAYVCRTNELVLLLLNHPAELDSPSVRLERAKNLTVDQVRRAKNWETAHYDAEFAEQLGLRDSEGTGGTERPSE